ncbi:uncharacterized protein LACBIDRAFT_308041 [Laccaria bicolor S238N-H82]|uniref:Predicted protein n=1 Tax=Laccaria bicolor (strain S238N-H82 / ATCC MYA-4686) TaxID=486041 RepID=B0DRH8_LACBS|nr:uncharacterized protein LACBIDRAFT_308041 [Laccaria bicolor S238N-H82]EDR02874.1 predicted protein [Laccaria bicolor S238N-H82]|eukprot:XP_001886584.1 predicted protein [Laccaria bicolor S238N-H82]
MEGDEEFGFGLQDCVGDMRLRAKPLAALELTITGIWQESHIGLRSATGCNSSHELPQLEAPMARSLYASSSNFFSNSSSSSHHVTFQLKELAQRSFRHPLLSRRRSSFGYGTF